MKAKGYLPLALLLLCCPFASAGRLYLKPFDGELSVAGELKLGSELRLTLKLRSNLPDPVLAEVIFIAPDGVIFTSPRRSTLYLHPGELRPATAALRPLKPGIYPIQAIVYPSGQHFSAFISVGPDGGKVLKRAFLPAKSVIEPQVSSLPLAAGRLKVVGKVEYFDDTERKLLPIKNLPVILYEHNLLIDFKLAESITDEEGRFEFPQISNLEANGTRLDVYVVAVFDNDVLRIKDEVGEVYQLVSALQKNAPDGVLEINLKLDENHPHRGLGAIFNGIQRAHRFFLEKVGWSRSKIDLLYPANTPMLIYSYTYDQLSGEIISERIDVPFGEEWNRTGIYHEYGHSVMTAAYGFNFFELPISEEFAGKPHWVHTVSDEKFAMNEGWAEFVEAAVEDNAFNLRGYTDRDLPNIETNRWWTGDVAGEGDNRNGAIVEGAVASILWDITDSPQSIDHQPGVDDDRISDMFPQLWEIFTRFRPKSVVSIARKWKELSFPNYDALLEIYAQNGVQIEPNEPPSVRIISPSGRTVVPEKLLISWEASDPDGDPMRVDLYYDMDQSPPGLLIASDVKGSEYVWDVSELPNGRYYVYLVVADPKGGEAVAYSDPVIVDHDPLLPPLISSPTHPDPNRWYPVRDVRLVLESRSSKFSVLLDRKPDSVPDEIPDLTSKEVSYHGLSDGIWWFHARAYSSLGYWSDASHFRICIDSTPPPLPEVRAEAVSGRLVVRWSEVDDLSGVERYKVRIKRQPSGEMALEREVRGRELEARLGPGVYRAEVSAVNGAGLEGRPGLSDPVEIEAVRVCDLNGDGAVDIFDLVIIAHSFGSEDGADLNGDGVVDIFDLVMAAAHFGERISPGAPNLMGIRTELLPPYPNPFNSELWLPFRLSRAGTVIIEIFDLSGGLVRRLNLGPLEPGDYSLRGKAAQWDGRDERGQPLPSGVYFCLLRVEGRPIGMRRVLLLR